MKYSSRTLLACLLALAAAAGALPAGPAYAQAVRPYNYVPGTMGIPQPEPKVTLSVKNRSLNGILYELFKQIPYKYAVRTQVGLTVLTLEVKDAPISQALNQLLAQDTKKEEPLVWSFHRNPAGGGTFLIDRELIELGQIEGENRVSLSNARLTKVLPRVFQLMQAKGRVEPDVPPILLTMQLRPSVWHQALPQVILEAYKQEPAITYSLDGDTYVVHMQKTPIAPRSVTEADDPAFRKVRVAIDNLPLRDALARLLMGSRWKYQVSPAVKDTRVTFASDQPELAALHGLLRQAAGAGAPITYREGQGVLYIEPGPLPGQASAETALPIAGPRTVTLKLNLVLKRVAAQLEEQSGATIRVAETVPNLPTDVNVVNGTVEDALKAIVNALRSSLPNVRYRSTGANAYVIELGTN